MIVLRVVLKNLGLLDVIEVADEFIGAKLFPPLFRVDEPASISHHPIHPSSYTETVNIHGLGRLDIKLPGSQEPQQGQGVQPIGVTQLLEFSPQLVHGSILLGVCMTRMPGLGLGGGGGEIIVVVLGLGHDGGLMGASGGFSGAGAGGGALGLTGLRVII